MTSVTRHLLTKYQRFCSTFFTARRYASAVYATALCLCLSVRLSQVGVLSKRRNSGLREQRQTTANLRRLVCLRTDNLDNFRKNICFVVNSLNLHTTHQDGRTCSISDSYRALNYISALHRCLFAIIRSISKTVRIIALSAVRVFLKRCISRITKCRNDYDVECISSYYAGRV